MACQKCSELSFMPLPSVPDAGEIPQKEWPKTDDAHRRLAHSTDQFPSR